MKALSVLVQVGLFLVATFTFIVLIDHGPRDFLRNAAIEWDELSALVMGSGR